jgi:hypothetical protein
MCQRNRACNALNSSVNRLIRRNIPQFAAADCVKTHIGGGLVQFFLVNDGENRRHGGCSIGS